MIVADVAPLADSTHRRYRWPSVLTYGHYNWGGNYTVGASSSIEYTDLTINGVPAPLCS